MLSVAFYSWFKLNVVILNVIMLNVVMLSAVMLSVIMLSVIMPSVVAPLKCSSPLILNVMQFFDVLCQVNLTTYLLVG